MNRIAVVGAGTMGHGIAQVAAQAGYAATLSDARPDALAAAADRIRKNLEGAVQRGKLSQDGAADIVRRVAMERNVEAAVRDADLVIEAIVENLDAKRALLQRVESAAPDGAIFATNTSSLSITAIASAVRDPGRVVGMHFFNPVHIMKLVEIVTHEGARPEVVADVRDCAVRMGKEPILVKDSPGFASSRLGVVLGLEAMRMVEAGVASAEDIDRAMELGYGHPMGPLRVTDLVGLDVRLAIAEYLHRELESPRYEPPRILREKVGRGELGKKTGKGFFDWPK